MKEFGALKTKFFDHMKDESNNKKMVQKTVS